MTPKQSSNRGGKRAGAGRPPLSEGYETVPVVIRLTSYQRQKLQELGGPAWVREQIDLRIAKDSKK
jgi:hypothetical protein